MERLPSHTSGDAGTNVEVLMNSESSSDGQSKDELADAIFAAKPRAPERVMETLAHLNVEQLGIAGPAHGGGALALDGLPWPRVGRYQLLEQLGRGAMGEVWLGLDNELGRKVALKQLRPRSAHHKDRLRREAQALARLSHPNVVTVYGVEKDHGQLFIAMELVEGQTLQQWQECRPTPTWADCLRAYVQAGRGLAAAHAAGLVHRDFKPSNCMIDGQGRVKVLDFGLVSRAMEDVENSMKGAAAADTLATSAVDEGVDDVLSRSLTQTGMFVGTQAYMAPEAMGGASISGYGDQFSFCVSLYEAVYGERPFEGETRSALADAVMTGRIRAAPKAPPVPSRLRRVLLRGLEVDAKRRWPAMDALLVELERQIAPKRGRWIAFGAAGVGLMVGAALGVRRYAGTENPCSDASRPIAEVWNEARSETVRSIILSTKLPYAVDTWKSVSSGLDDYSEELASKYTDACEAAAVRHEQSDHERDLRMRCLRDGKNALGATVKVLVRADAPVEHAASLVSALPRLGVCDDVEQLLERRLRLPVPEDPQLALEVDALKEQLAAVRVEQDAGRYRAALDLIEPIVRRSKEIGYPPLLAESIFRRGSLRSDNGLYMDSEQDMREAFALATQHGHDEVDVAAANLLAHGLSINRSRYDEAEHWCEVALPLARREGDPNLPLVLRTLGLVSLGKGDPVDAESHYREALEHFRNAGAAPEQVAQTLNDLGLSLRGQGRYLEEEEQQRLALRTREQALGSEHPLVAMSLNNLGIAVESQGRYDEANGYYRRSLRIREQALGMNDLLVARSAESLGTVLMFQHSYEESEHYHRRVLRIRQGASSGDDLGVATSLANVGLVLLVQGDYDDAETHFRRSVEMMDRLLAEKHPNKLSPLIGLASVALACEDYETAREHAERAVAISESNTVAPGTLAEAHFSLARALWSDPAERRRALVLAQWALDEYTHAGVGREDSVAEVNEWIQKGGERATTAADRSRAARQPRRRARPLRLPG